MDQDIDDATDSVIYGPSTLNQIIFFAWHSRLPPYVVKVLDNLYSNGTAFVTYQGTKLYGEFTGIVFYADDIILMSATLSGLQKMIDRCVKYGYNHLIKFNTKKTEFVMSGKPPLKNPFIILHGNPIYPTDSLKHLGFV